MAAMHHFDDLRIRDELYDRACRLKEHVLMIDGGDDQGRGKQPFPIALGYSVSLVNV